MRITSNNITEYFSPAIAEINPALIARQRWRLDANFYILFSKTTDVLTKNIETKSLSECCNNIYEVPPFVHIYVEKEHGIPFYTSSALFESDLQPSHFLSLSTKDLNKYIIKKGQILIARSGDVSGGILGTITMVGDKLDGVTTSDHVIRFVPNSEIIKPGYLCAYLKSSIGRDVLVMHASGSVIPAIRPEALHSIRIPLLSRSIQEKIHINIMKALKNREEVIDILKEAEKMVYLVNGLTELQNKGILTFDDEHEIEFSIINSKEIIQSHGQISEFRLDARYYNPMTKLVLKNLRSCKSNLKSLSDLSKEVFMCERFARTYVDKENGVPFLSGQNIIQIRPAGLKYVSKTETSKLNELRLEKGWILITRSGTIGRICLVWHNFEEWCATEDIIRIIPNYNMIDSGYLLAFISSIYGNEQILRYRHGSVIEHITPKQIQNIFIPIPSIGSQKIIGDKVRSAYEKRAEAIRLEDEAQEILMKELGVNKI